MSDLDILESALSFYRPGATINSDVLRDDLIVAAQVNPSVVGALLGTACEKGWLHHTGFVKSKRPEAKGRWILTYEVATS